jgi:hypothetical protein
MHRLSMPVSIAGGCEEGGDVTDGIVAIARANVERTAT